jgi:rubrerythrin
MTMNVFDYAMKMELDGKAFYEKLAEETSQPALRSVFRSMADDEQKHFETFHALKAGTAGAMADSRILETTRNVFEEMTQDKSLAAMLKSTLDGYETARKVEADSVRFYEDMAAKETDPAKVQLILTIANEEKKHYNILDNLCDFTLAPQNYLAWGEFSNLKDL